MPVKYFQFMIGSPVAKPKKLLPGDDARRQFMIDAGEKAAFC